MTKQTEAELLHEVCDMVLEKDGLLTIGRQRGGRMVSVDISLPGRLVYADTEYLRQALEHCLKEMKS